MAQKMEVVRTSSITQSMLDDRKSCGVLMCISKTLDKTTSDCHGLPNDGTPLESFPDGGVFMLQRLASPSTVR